MRGTQLFLTLDSASLDGIAELIDADGFVIGPGAPEPPTQDPKQSWILRSLTPLDAPAWSERQATWVCCEGLERTARLRDGWPKLTWVPRAEVYRPSVRYDFVAARRGEGFSVYRPDTSVIQRYRVAEDEADLHDWLIQARSQGFRKVWLHSRDAAARDRGLDLDLLDRARRSFAGGRIWLSGGAVEPRHLANLTVEGGAAAVVLPVDLAERCGCASLLAALAPRDPDAEPTTRGASAPSAAARAP